MVKDMPVTSQKTLFRELIRLVGKKVEVGISSTGEKLSGVIANTMFDSFIVDTTKGRRVIRFSDVFFLIPIPD